MKRSSMNQGLLVLLAVAIGAAYTADVNAQEGTLVADGLNGPMGVVATPDGAVWVIDSGTGGEQEAEGVHPVTREPATFRSGDTARIIKIGADGSTEIIQMLPSAMWDAQNTFGGGRLAMLDGVLYATSAEWSETAPPDRPPFYAAVVRIADGERTELANTWDLERDENPDGLWVESNPYG